MAVQYESISAPAVASLVSDIVIDKPSGTVAGDMLVATISTMHGQGETSAPSGWTLLLRTRTGTGANTEILLETWWKIAGSSEPDDYTFQYQISGFPAQRHAAGSILRFSGQHATPISDSDEHANTGSVSTITVGPVTTSNDDGMYLAIGAARFTTERTATLSGWDERADFTDGSFRPGIAIYTRAAPTAGSSGTATITWSGSTTNQAAHLFAIEPAGAPTDHDLEGGTAFELAGGGTLEQEHALAAGTAFEVMSGAEVDVVAAHDLAGGTAFSLASGGALQQDHQLAGGTAFEMVSSGVLQVDNATLLAGGTAFEFVSGGEMPGDHPLRAGTAFLLVSGAGLAQPTQFRAGTAFRLESGDAYSGPGTGLVVPVTPALVPVPSAGALPAPIADPFVNVREGDEFPVLLPWAGIVGMSGLARVLSRSVSDEWGRQRLNVQFVRQPDPDTVPQLGAGAVVPYHEPVKGDLRQITRIRQRQERERRR